MWRRLRHIHERWWAARIRAGWIMATNTDLRSIHGVGTVSWVSYLVGDLKMRDVSVDVDLNTWDLVPWSMKIENEPIQSKPSCFYSQAPGAHHTLSVTSSVANFVIQFTMRERAHLLHTLRLQFKNVTPPNPSRNGQWWAAMKSSYNYIGSE